MPFIILVRIPNWLGDAVMASFALEILYQSYPEAHFYLVGAKSSLTLFENNPNTTCLADESKKSKSRILTLWKLAKSVPQANLAFTFQNNFLSALFLWFNNAKIRVGYANELRSPLLTHHPKKPKNTHEALRFEGLVRLLIQNHTITPKTYLQKPKQTPLLPQNFINQKIIGINAGAAFGSAKRWEEEYFAQIIQELLALNFKIILFGVASENPINKKILSYLDNPKDSNILNLSGKTNLQELMAYFLKLDFLLTNDSGPMHIAGAFEIPTLAIFGPTDSTETCAFNAKNTHIISLQSLKQPLSCAPCKKRSCPLPKDSKDFHACMRDLTPKKILPTLFELLSKNGLQSQKILHKDD